MARLVSKVYGEALYEFAKENNQLEKIYEESLDVIEVFNASSDIKDFLANPKTNDDDKIEFLKGIFVDKLWAGPVAKVFKFFNIDVSKGKDPKIIDFLSIIVRKGRQKEIVPILKYFTHMTLASKNIGEADVTSATALTEEQKTMLEKKLVDTTDFDSFIVNYNVDKSLIAGIKIKVEDKVYDTSLKTKILDISKSLRGLKL